MATRKTESYPRARWAGHFGGLRWDQGDHLLIAAPTKAGKTTMVSKLASKRLDAGGHVVMFVSKARDDTIRREFRGWERVHEWPKHGLASWQNRVLLWPKPAKTMAETNRIQRDVFAVALDKIFHQGRRCVIVDETLYFCDAKDGLGLGGPLGVLHYHGRSNGITCVTLSQRPAWIPRVIYSSATHAYIARTRDTEDLRRLADLGGIDTPTVRNNLASLPSRHDYLYCNPQGDSSPVIVNTRE